jgi:hypothetical protein
MVKIHLKLVTALHTALQHTLLYTLLTVLVFLHACLPVLLLAVAPSHIADVVQGKRGVESKRETELVCS